MKASAYADGANAVEGAYLVSPVMDLTNRNEIVLTFKHALGHAKTIEPAEMLSLWVREENMDWSVQLPIQAWPSYEGVVRSTPYHSLTNVRNQSPTPLKPTRLAVHSW